MSGRPDSKPPSTPKTPVRSHEEYRELLESHIDGELGAAERQVLFEHLESCQECRETLEAEERLLDRLSRIPRLTPPVDLRAQVLREAIRERQELSQALDEDERYAPIFCEPQQAPHAAPRHRSRWSRYSPVAATAFLVVAGFGALLSSDFSGFPQMARTQAATRHALASLSRLLSPTPAPAGPSRKIELAQPPSRMETPLPAEGSAQSSVLALPPGTPSPEPKNAVPAPAEQARPVTLAVVLKSLDEQAQPAVPQQDFDQVLQTAQSRFGGNVANEDQFVYDGHRYRCYTLQVSPQWLKSLEASLAHYRAPAESPLLRVLSDQGHDLPANEQVAFFAAPKKTLADAVQALAPGAPRPSDPIKQVRLYLIE